MKRNIELLTKVRDLVKNEPAKLDMSLWGAVSADLVEFNGGYKARVSCGTTACVAGWAVQLAGDKLLIDEDHYDDDYPKLGSEDEYEKVFTVGQSVAKNGRILDIEERARKLLGLTEDETNVLFFAPDGSDGALDLLNTLIAGDDIYEDSADDWDDGDD